MREDTHSAEDIEQESVESASSSAAASASSSSAAGAASAAAASTSSDDTSALEEEIAKLTEALAEAKDAALRAQAEAQNTRRRAEQDVERAHKYALEKFVGDLLPVADNLERAIAAASDGAEANDVSAVTEGVELTLKTLMDALKRHKVEQINPINEPFDPQVHQAMTAVENGEVEPNTVLDVFQKGYLLNGRLVRPAMVVVSKAPAA